MTSFVQQGTRKVPTGTPRVPQQTIWSPQGGLYYSGGSYYNQTYPVIIDFTTGYLDPRINYTHSSANCWGFDSTGLLVNFAAVTPRFDYGAQGGGACRGLMIETTSTNRMLYSRDATQAAWTKSGSMTAALTGTGLGGVANSASRLTAGGADQTCFQSVTLGSALRCFTGYVKRVTGTGTVEVTDDGGATYTDITSNLSTSSWYRFYAQHTQANPNVGFRIRTSGDVILFDCCNLEDGNTPTLPIITTSATVQKTRGDVTITGVNLMPWFNPFEGTVIADFIVDYASDASTSLRRVAVNIHNSSDAANERISVHISNTATTNNMNGQMVDGGSSVVNVNSSAKATASITQKIAQAYKLNDSNFSWNGSVATTDSACTIPTVDTLVIGGRLSSLEQMNGVIAKLRYYNRRLTNAELQTATTL